MLRVEKAPQTMQLNDKINTDNLFLRKYKLSSVLEYFVNFLDLSFDFAVLMEVTKLILLIV